MAEYIKKKFGRDVHMSSLETILVRAPNRSLPDAAETLVVNVGFGVNIYKNAISTEACHKHIATINSELDEFGRHSWLAPEPGRNASYFLTSEELLPAENKDYAVLRGLHNSVSTVVKQCIDDYAKSWNISISHYDPLNFVKYSHPYNNFDHHIDDNPDNPRTVSAVVYLNDDYVGGEFSFSRLDDLTIKPETGDIIVLPSNYLYEHESKPVTEGVKYAVAVFTHFKERV